MSSLRYVNSDLYLEDIRLIDIAEQFGTPCYVYSHANILQNWLAYASTLHGIRHRVAYAVKANSNLAILNLLARLGSSFDIVSEGELQRVLKAGGLPKNIIFSGVGKSTSELLTAIRQRIYCINIESEAELDRVAQLAAAENNVISISLRVNPHIDARTHAHISTGLKESKFGIDINDAIPLCRKIKTLPSLKLIGIACHIGSQIVELEPFQQANACMLQLYNDIAKEDIHVSDIDLGGGLGIRYHNEHEPSLSHYIQQIKDTFAHLPVEIILEPGRSIVGNAGILLTRVEYLKHSSHKNFAIIDAGMNDLIRPALYDAWQNILPVHKHSFTPTIYDVAGPVCESSDILGKDRSLAIKTGDLLAIDNAGAYGFTMSSNYNSRCRPVEILVDGNKLEVIRHRETISELFASERIP